MAQTQPEPSSSPEHPFANTKSLLTIIRDDHVDIEEEARFYEDFADDTVDSRVIPPSRKSVDAHSIISHEIWLDDHTAGMASSTFARDATISGWTCVGDTGGAYIVYDCVITTKEGNAIHTLKRYNDFVALRRSIGQIITRETRFKLPSLPPKSPLAKFRPAFLDKRRRALQQWLCAVLLHPEIGGSIPVRNWVMA